MTRGLGKVKAGKKEKYGRRREEAKERDGRRKRWLKEERRMVEG